MISKLNILLKYMHPTGYTKITDNDGETNTRDLTESLCSDKLNQKINMITANHLECFEPEKIDDTIYRSIHEIRTILHNQMHATGPIIIDGWMPNIPANSIKNEPYFDERIREVKKNFQHIFQKRYKIRTKKNITMKLSSNVF